MLEFFRKYQTYFFAVITVIIIFSFSFFGTYNTLPGNSIHEQVAFTTIDGTQVTRHELDEMVAFLSTDGEDKILWGGAWGPNFLNDGVIRKDILETGIADILVASYPEAVESDLQSRLEKERFYRLYVHPNAKFISVEGAWNYVSPSMNRDFAKLQKSTQATTPEAFQARVNLYLAERQFPAPLLRQILRYQERQYGWTSPDPLLDQTDLSLFGYHSLDDWFGPRFIRLVGQFIFNASELAQQHGYVVSKDEAWADLLHNAELSYRQNLNSPHLGVANSQEYLEEQLRRVGIDQAKAIKIWQKVLLFRRLFEDVGNSIFIDPLSYQQFFAFSEETMRGDLYRLPAALRLSDYKSLQKFELYLDAVSKHNQNDLMLPKSYNSLADVKAKYPELIKRQYVLQVAQVAKSTLQSKVALKAMWNWETQDKNWDRLVEQFPELGVKNAKTRDERLAVLDDLEAKVRNRIDQMARAAIVEAHPQWIDEALSSAPKKQMTLAVRIKGGKPIFGLDNREELMTLLNNAPIGTEKASTPAAMRSEAKLARFSGDESAYYQIKVLERTPQEEILTFAEANREGVLDQLLDKELESQYAKMRASKTDLRPFAEMRNQVADQYLETVLAAIQVDFVKATQQKQPVNLTGDRSASLRLYAYVRDLQNKLAAGKIDPQSIVQTSGQETLANQWKLEKVDYTANRATVTGDLNIDQLFSIQPMEWTKIETPVNGDYYFLQLKERNVKPNHEVQLEKLSQAQQLIADEAERNFANKVVQEFKEKKALSLDYLGTSLSE